MLTSASYSLGAGETAAKILVELLCRKRHDLWDNDNDSCAGGKSDVHCIEDIFVGNAERIEVGETTAGIGQWFFHEQHLKEPVPEFVLAISVGRGYRL